MDYFNLKHNILNQTYPGELKSACYLVDNLYEYIINNPITKIVIVSEQELDTTIRDIRGILKKYDLFINEYNKNLNEHIINGCLLTWNSRLPLSKILNIPIDEILVVGDGDNDLEMLSKFPNSICMSNGTEKAKKLARYITKKDNNNSGVAEGLNYYITGGVKKW